MTRIVRGQLKWVRLDEQGNPMMFQDKDTIHRVQKVIGSWKEQGRWWEREEQRDTYRVVTDEGVYELEYQNKQWTIYRIFDSF